MIGKRDNLAFLRLVSGVHCIPSSFTLLRGWRRIRQRDEFLYLFSNYFPALCTGISSTREFGLVLFVDFNFKTADLSPSSQPNDMFLLLHDVSDSVPPDLCHL